MLFYLLPSAKRMRPLLLLGVLLSLGHLPGCKCSKEKDETDVAAASNVPTEGPSVRDSLTFLTPEQISAQIKAVFGVDYGYTDDTGTYHDSLIENYAVALGGIDYVVAKKRDNSPRVQTLLITRSLAWDLTNRVANDVEQGVAGRFMTIADIANDRPFHSSDSSRSAAEQDAIHASEVRWNAQIDEIYWKLYGRGPSSAELDLIRTAFLEAYVLNNYYAPMAWRLVIFSLISSLEFWST